MSIDIKWQVPKAQPEASELAVVYARYSSHSQGEQSIEGQLSNARDYAAAHGYTIVHEYVDRAKSGRTDNRAEFQQMLKDTAKRQFSVIILWKVDRFGRNREEIAINKMKCRKNGVRVEYVAETIPDSPEGVILESVLEGFAEYYSLQLSQNIRRGRAESAEKCQSLGGNRPLGYKTGPDKKFVIDENTAPTVKMIFTMYADGKTVTEIVDKLNELGLRTLRGGPFTKNSLHSILKNKKYIGIYEYQGREIKDGVPRIIEDDVFNKVQEMLKINKRAPAKTWSRADYILTDKLFCGKCGALMFGESGTSKTGAKHNYYICSNKKRFRSCDKKAVRQADIGVSIYFEEQGIDTAAIDLEMILTFPGMAAQKESETISENMRWSYQKRMESGDFNCCKAAYGYELIDGQLYINEAEAVVIRRIFDLYLQGCGKQAIANQLNTDGIPRRYGYKTWHLNAIHYILNNERYMGDALLQKNYTTETLPFRKRRNRGEKPQYYVENSNPAIVSREVFQAAQALQQRKTAGGSAPKNRYPFSGVLRCPVCGHAYRRQVTNGTAFWLCSYKASGRSECASDRVPENMVKEAFMRMSGKLADNREELLGDLIRQLEKLQNRTSGSGERIYQLNRQIADVNAQNLVVAQLHSSGILNNAEYAAQSGELNRKVSELRSERRRILMEDEDNEVIESLRALDEIMADYAPTEDFDEDLFGQIVESITVVSKNALRFCLAGGLALTERI